MEKSYRIIAKDEVNGVITALFSVGDRTLQQDVPVVEGESEADVKAKIYAVLDKFEQDLAEVPKKVDTIDSFSVDSAKKIVVSEDANNAGEYKEEVVSDPLPVPEQPVEDAKVEE